MEKKKKLFKFNSEMDLTSGDTKTLIKKFILFSLPLIAVGILQLLYNSFDLIAVQQKEGIVAGAAVGANGSLIALITNGFVGLSTGLNVVIARFYGKGDKEGANNALHTGLLIAFFSGVFLAIFGFFMARYFLERMKVSETYIDLATDYLSIYFLSMPFMLIYNFGASAFRGVGDSTKPLIFLTSCGLLNIGLNYLFVFSFGWGVKGVAISTVLCQALSATLVIIFLYINKGFIRLRFKELKIHKTELLQILQIGVPSGLQGILFSISNVILQTTVNTWPAEVVSANTDAANIESYTYTAMYGVAQATPTFISANFGKGNVQNIKKIHIISIITVIVVGIVLGYTSLALADPLLSFYMGENFDPEVVIYAKERMQVVLLTYFLCGLMDNENGLLKGLGYAILPTIYTVIGCCIFRIIWNYFIYSPDVTSPLHSLGLLYACYPVSWIIVTTGHEVTYLILKRKWTYNALMNKLKFNREEYLKKEKFNA